MAPRVSIMMPAYNAAATLPLALASMMAQTFADWEAIVVDDGSTDATAEVVQACADPRIQLVRMPINRGRPHARAVALDTARGDYLCMLDADDWMYPQRLAKQIKVLDETPEAGAVSAGMAIVDPQGNIVGARAFGEAGNAGLSALYAPPAALGIAHAPSMLRRALVGSIRPDLRLSRGQDTDFMMRVLRGHRYVLLPELLYAYAEGHSFTRENVLAGHRLGRIVQAKYLTSHPVRAGVNWCKCLLKETAARALFAVGQERRLLRARSRPPAAEQVERFELARGEVRRFLADSAD
jgi:glycosyltransferase involved in cell wall biosynthesis